MVIVLLIWFSLFVEVLGSNGENKLAFAFLSVPFAALVLLIAIADWMWRSHQAKEKQKSPLRNVAELMRRDPPG